MHLIYIYNSGYLNLLPNGCLCINIRMYYITISISFAAQILLKKLDVLETDRQFTKHFNFITKLSRSGAAEDIRCLLHASLRKKKSFTNSSFFTYLHIKNIFAVFYMYSMHTIHILRIQDSK